MTGPLVSINDLKMHFNIPGKGELHAVDGVSFNIMPNETVGLVGESGCGKSTVGNVLIGLLKATAGSVMFDDRDILKLKKNELNEVRKKMQIIFQDPYSSLNPRETVSAILADPYQIHRIASGAKLKEKIKELANSVGLEDYVLDKYPHELDGGKRQLVGIARALSLGPKFIICDEPVSALDVSVQATIINLLIDMQKKMGLSYLFVSHDLSVVRHISTKVAVMYLGQIIEFADTDEIFASAHHPYTIALLSAVPQINFVDKKGRIVLKGDVPSPINPEPGCRFAPRCPMAQECCKTQSPQLREIAPGHTVACHFWEESREKML